MSNTIEGEKSAEVLPGGVNSPVRACKGLLASPLIITSGKGNTITDIKGNSYLDFCASWGAIIHGHAHPAILNPVKKRIDQGTSFGITCPIEESLARKITEHIPSIDMVRFVSSGTEATMSAIRLARGYTGRDKIIKFTGHYHGHADHLLVKAGSGVTGLPESSSAGVPKEFLSHTICLPFNDCGAFLSTIDDSFAAVILEPVAGNMGLVPATKEFIKTLRQETKNLGVVLIFDEVMTGFRLGLNGAQALYNTDADLTCLGKVIGGGFNVGAFGGKREIMEHIAPLGSVYQAGTLSGNPVAMEAGYQALKLCEDPELYHRLEKKTARIVEPVREMIDKHAINACVQQQGSMMSIFFGKRTVHSFEDVQKVDKESFCDFFRTMFKNGVYIPPSHCEAWFIMDAHSDQELDNVSDLIVEYLEKWRKKDESRTS